MFGPLVVFLVACLASCFCSQYIQICTQSVQHGANQGRNHGANQGRNHGANHGRNHGANHGANYGRNHGANHSANKGTEYGTSRNTSAAPKVGRPVPQAIQHSTSYASKRDKNVPSAVPLKRDAPAKATVSRGHVARCSECITTVSSKCLKCTGVPKPLMRRPSVHIATGARQTTLVLAKSVPRKLVSHTGRNHGNANDSLF